MKLQYHFHKIFRMGKKTGQQSKFPTITVVAESDAQARELAQPLMKKGLEYNMLVGEPPDDSPAALAQNSAPAVAGSDPAAPIAWKKHDPCWYKTSTYEDNYVMGYVMDVTDTEKHGPVVHVWGETGGSRHKLLAEVLRQPPKGQIKKLRQRKIGKEARASTKPVARIKRKEG